MAIFAIEFIIGIETVEVKKFVLWAYIRRSLQHPLLICDTGGLRTRPASCDNAVRVAGLKSFLKKSGQNSEQQ